MSVSDLYISSSRKGRPIVEIYNSLTDTWMWKLGLRPRYSFSGNICFTFSAFCLCSVEYQSVCPFVEIGSPTPFPEASVSTPLAKGRGVTFVCFRGWGDPTRTTGQKAWHSVYYCPGPSYTLPPPPTTICGVAFLRIWGTGRVENAVVKPLNSMACSF